MSVAASTPITAEQLFAMPEDGIDRELIRGQLREKPMTRRNRFHSQAVARISSLLDQWLQQQPEPCGCIYAGEIGCILRRDPDTAVGIDVAYFSAEVVARQTDETTMMDGAPILAVEVLSPSDKHEEVHEKVSEYLESGVQLVWIVDPYFQTVQVHQPDTAPEMFNHQQTLRAAGVIPGLEVPVADIFPQRSSG